MSIKITFQNTSGEWAKVSFEVVNRTTKEEALDFARRLKLSRDTICIYVESSKHGRLGQWLRHDCDRIRRGLRD